MPSEFRVLTGGFERATKELQKSARTNCLLYGKSIAAQYQKHARREAEWTDHRGVARRGLQGYADASGNVVRVHMTGSAPNYKKRGHWSAADYMEFLEFDYGKKYAIVYPVVQSMKNDVVRQFGNAVLNGGYRVQIKRDKKALAYRKIWYKTHAGQKRTRGQHI